MARRSAVQVRLVSTTSHYCLILIVHKELSSVFVEVGRRVDHGGLPDAEIWVCFTRPRARLSFTPTPDMKKEARCLSPLLFSRDCIGSGLDDMAWTDGTLTML